MERAEPIIAQPLPISIRVVEIACLLAFGDGGAEPTYPIIQWGPQSNFHGRRDVSSQPLLCADRTHTANLKMCKTHIRAGYRWTVCMSFVINGNHLIITSAWAVPRKCNAGQLAELSRNATLQQVDRMIETVCSSFISERITHVTVTTEMKQASTGFNPGSIDIYAFIHMCVC